MRDMHTHVLIFEQVSFHSASMSAFRAQFCEAALIVICPTLFLCAHSFHLAQNNAESSRLHQLYTVTDIIEARATPLVK